MQTDQGIYCTAFGLASKGQLGGQVPHVAANMKSGAEIFATINAVQVQCPLNGRTFLKVASGENHNVFLADNLQVLSTGSNVYGQLGNGQTIPADQ